MVKNIYLLNGLIINMNFHNNVWIILIKYTSQLKKDIKRLNKLLNVWCDLLTRFKMFKNINFTLQLINDYSRILNFLYIGIDM